MPVKRRASKMKQGLSEAAIRYLRDDVDNYDGLSLNGFNELCALSAHGSTPYHLNGDAARQVCGLSSRELVEQYGAEYLKAYVIEHRGRRPAWWWKFNVADNDEPLRRQRIGGIGTVDGEWWDYGVPSNWVTLADQTEDRTWPGKPLASDEAVDPANAPTFESQATFLERHHLLLPGERRRLTAADYKPESILDIFKFDPDELLGKDGDDEVEEPEAGDADE